MELQNVLKQVILLKISLKKYSNRNSLWREIGYNPQSETNRVQRKDHKFPKDPRDREKVLLTLKEDGVELQNVLKQVILLKISWKKLLGIKNLKFPRYPRDREKVLLTLKEDGVELQNVLKQVCRIVHFEYSDVPNVAHVFQD